MLRIRRGLDYRVCEANISKPSDARLYRARSAYRSPKANIDAWADACSRRKSHGLVLCKKRRQQATALHRKKNTVGRGKASGSTKRSALNPLEIPPSALLRSSTALRMTRGVGSVSYDCLRQVMSDEMLCIVMIGSAKLKNEIRLWRKKSTVADLIL